LPDGIFSKQESKIGYILEGLGIDNVGIFCGRSEYLKTIWYVSLPFGIFWQPIGAAVLELFTTFRFCKKIPVKQS
jgi:hypothetical protein